MAMPSSFSSQQAYIIYIVTGDLYNSGRYSIQYQVNACNTWGVQAIYETIFILLSIAYLGILYNPKGLYGIRTAGIPTVNM